MEGFNLMQGDCLELMKTIPDSSVDMILCDLPYGTTACKWDSIIPFAPMWSEYKRVCKPGAAIVLTASQPFSTALISSNIKAFAYSWIWDKGVGANFVQAKRMPLKTTEDVLVFCINGKTPVYNPQMTPKDKPSRISSHAVNSGSIPICGQSRDNFEGKEYTESYPSQILSFSNRAKGQRGLHPTQKPVALMEYMIKTYTDEGDVVLDCVMGSGTTGVACANTGRNFIGIEMDEKYFQIAKDRIQKAMP